MSVRRIARGRAGRFCLAGIAAAAALATPCGVGASVTIKDLVELTDIGSLNVSPDGRFAVFRTERADVVRNTYIMQWHSVDLATSIVRDIGSAGDPIYNDPGMLSWEKVRWSSDGRTIIVRALVDGAVGLWRANVDGSGMQPLTRSDADVIDFSMANDGTSVDYVTGATREQIRRAEVQEYDSGILVNSTVDISHSLYQGGSINGRMATQRLVGYWWLRDGLLWRSPRQHHRIDPETGIDETVGPPQAVPAFDLSKYQVWDIPSNDGRDVVTTSLDGSKRSVSITFKGGRKISCADPVCTQSGLSSWVWVPRSHDLILTFKDRELRQALYVWDSDRNLIRPITSAEGLLNGGHHDFFPCAPSAAAAICVASGPASPPRLESVDLATGKRRILFDPNSELRADYHPRVQFLKWSIDGGLEAGGILLTPAGPSRKPAPLYINYYRCDGFLRGGEGGEWPIPQLLEAGYAVACINLVSIPGPPDAVRNYEVGLRAVRTLIDKLSREGVIDRSKVVMGGLSFGSEVALWVAIHSRLLAALSISSGELEPSSYWFGSIPPSDIPGTQRKVWGLGAPDETPERWRIVSPALNTDAIQIPILFQLPESEARFIPELYTRLSRQGTPTELYGFPDEAHVKLQPRHRFAVYERNFDWFRYWLEGVRDADPAKADQYRRWDELRKRWKPQGNANATTAAKAQERPTH